MELWQAMLIGLFAYLGRNQVPWLFGTTGGFYGVGRPLVAGLIIGIILGNVEAGVLAGVAVQAIFIGQIVPGGALPSDLNLAAYIGIPLAIVAGGDANMAVALAVPLGALGVAFHNLTMTVNSVWAHRADKYAAEGNAKQVRISNLLGTLVPFIERFGIVTLTLYLGAGFAESVITGLPQYVLDFLAVGGKMLPALGFAVLLNQIVTERWMLSLFILGWVIMTSFGLTTTALLLISIAIALLFVKASNSNNSGRMVSNEDVIFDGGDEDDEYEE